MRMPVVFFGHGSPMGALRDTATTRGWHAIGRRVDRDYGRPRAILCVSAHWLTRGAAVTAMRVPKTIHDFGSFPQELFDVRYPAPGHPELAARIVELLAPVMVTQDHGAWGLDHGTWTVLSKAWPDADIPVVQFSLDGARAAWSHYRLAERLRALRDEGVVIVGSGNIVHNPRMMDRRNVDTAAHAWATAFETTICDAVANRDHTRLVNFSALGEVARLSAPTPEHFWPLLYAAAAADADDTPELFRAPIEHASISMSSAAWWPGDLLDTISHPAV